MQIFAPLIHFLRLLTELLRAAGIGGEEQEGGDDELNRDQSEVWLLMKDCGVPVEVRISDGGHNWALWRRVLPRAIQWSADCFTQERTPYGR